MIKNRLKPARRLSDDTTQYRRPLVVVDGDITELIEHDADVDPAKPGVYSIKYKVNDKSGNKSEIVTRNVRVVDTIPPVIELTGESFISITGGSVYIDPGAKALIILMVL